MDAKGVKTAIAAKRQELKQAEKDLANLEEKAAAIGASNEAAQTERKPKFHAFDYMQDSVKEWEQMRNEAAIGSNVNEPIGGCGCSSSAAPVSKAAFMASEVEQWEDMIKNSKKNENDDEEEES